MELTRKEKDMIKMNCSCGGVLESTGIRLERQDELDWQLASEQEVTAQQAMQPHTINRLELEDGKLYEYVSAAADLLAKARFLKARLAREFPRKYGVPEGFHIVNGEFYVHEVKDGDA